METSIPGKGLYKIKTKYDGNHENHQDRHVAKSFKLMKSIDSDKNLLPLANQEPSKIFHLLATKKVSVETRGFKVNLLTYKNERKQYLEQPEGFRKLDIKGEKLL